jgi:fused signal recognition particle receptor
VPTLNLDPILLCLLIPLAAQIPLAVVAILTVFSQRKKLSTTASVPESEAAPDEPAQPEPIAPEPEVVASEPPGSVGYEPPEAAHAAVPLEPEAGPLQTDTAPLIAAETTPLPRTSVASAEPESPTAHEPQTTAVIEVAPAASLVAEEVEAEAPVALEEPRRAPIRIGLGLRKTRENFLARIRAAITGSAKADEIYEGLEEALIGADVGVEGSLKLVEAVRARLKNDSRPDVIRDALKEEIERVLIAAERPVAESGDAPLVILMAGVNGVGKTTTVAKLAALMKVDRSPVLVAAADTFRAAAIDQLQVWCDRVGVDLIKHQQGSDPAAVAFDAVKAAIARKAKVVLIDTAGRLQTKVNLMEELKKISRVVGRELPGAPHEIWLVLDATTGQNALSQAKLFGETVPLTGVVLAKLDSTAKGGVIVGIAERLKLPVRYVGLGENLEDLRPFDSREFVEALFSESEGAPESASGTYAA